MVDQRREAAGQRGAGRVVPGGGDEHEVAQHGGVLEGPAVDVGVGDDAGQVGGQVAGQVGGRGRSPVGGQLREVAVEVLDHGGQVGLGARAAKARVAGAEQLLGEA